MHQCFFYFHTGLIHRTEIFLANSARWTNPIFWKIFKCCTWLYAILWVADSWVIHPTADITYVFLHSHIVLIVICCKYTHYTSNDKAKRVKVLLIYNNYNSVCYLWETLLCKKLLFCETSYTPVDLCKSVQSVGECFGCVGSTLLQNRQAEDVLPQISQILTDAACLEFCEFCVLWEYSSPTDCTDQHRWLGALVASWVRQDAIPSYICKSVLSVGDFSLQEASVRSVGSVGIQFSHGLH